MKRLKKCTVLGAGAGGQAIAADLTLAGVDVSLYEMPQFQQNIDPIIQRGGIEIIGKARRGFARLETVTTDIQQAIKGAKYLFIATQANAHEILARDCAPYLEEQQTIALLPGSGGSLQVAKTLKDLRVNKKVYIGETVTLPYVCTMASPGKVNVLATIGPRNYFSAFPSRDTPVIIEELKQFFPTLYPATNVLEAGLLNPNIVKHPMILFSLAHVELSKAAFCLNREGMTPSIWKIFNQVDSEKMEVLRKLGLKPLSYRELFSEISYISYEEFISLLPAFLVTTKHRFFAEDVPIGFVLLSSLGDMIGVETPAIDSIIRLVSIVNGTDYHNEGRTIERLGLSGMTVKSLNRYLATGE